MTLLSLRSLILEESHMSDLVHISTLASMARKLLKSAGTIVMNSAQNQQKTTSYKLHAEKTDGKTALVVNQNNVVLTLNYVTAPGIQILKQRTTVSQSSLLDLNFGTAMGKMYAM